MKKLFAVTIIALLALTVTTVFAATPDEGWTLGAKDGAVDPIDGSSEYPATEAWTASFDYYVNGSDETPEMPGYIGPANVCDFASGRPCTDTTAELNIHFDLTCSYSEVTLTYGRYGSEADNLYFNGTLIDIVSATEGGWNEFTYYLGSAPDGNNTLTIEYAGGGSGNGHYIDYLKLVPGGTVNCPVDIDIKPGSDPNSVNKNGNGVIPVAINGSADFDVTNINVSTLSFAGLDVRVKGNDAPQCAVEDWNMDGYADLVCQFVDDASTWEVGDWEAELTGQLYDGTFISGTDTIRIVQ